MNEEVRHFSLRKLSVGLASVLVGVSIFGASQTVKADTVANNQTSSVTNNTQSSDTQENKKNDNQVANTAKSKATQTQENDQKQAQAENVQQDSAPQTQEVNNSNDLDAEKNIVSTSSLQESDNQSNTVTKKTVQHDTLESGQKAQAFNLPKNSQKFNRKVLATNLIETTSSPTTNGGFDEATWGKLDVTKWQGSVQDGVYQLTGYTGDSSHIIVPNEADFEQAGKSTNGLQVGITRDTARSLLSNQTQTIAFSKTNNQKVKAIGTDWSNAFSDLGTSVLSKFDGSSLDVSNVTNISSMFMGNKISDLTSLANWDTSKVTDMNSMFKGNPISDLTPLANWNTGNVTDMSWMFGINKISNLTPLANWNTSKVTDMYYMFAGNPDLIDLRPIANWNLSNVKDQESDQDRFACLFYDDTKLDLTNINDTLLMKAFLKDPDMLGSAIFITNNADLVKATINQDLPNLTNTAKRTIIFNIPNATPETIVQTINYKAVAPVRVDFYYDDNEKIVQTYPVKESDWQLDDSKQNDAIIVNGQIRFASVKIPHINGYKAYIVPNKPNSALFTVSFIAIPTENKPATPVEATPSKPSAPTAPTENKPATPVEVAPSKPSAPTDRPSNSAWSNLDHKVVNALNQADSGWMLPADNSTYKAEVPTDNAPIDLSDLVIAQPVHAQTRAKITVTKRFKLRKHGKKHAVKHLKHRKKVAKQFKKYRL